MARESGGCATSAEVVLPRIGIMIAVRRLVSAGLACNGVVKVLRLFVVLVGLVAMKEGASGSGKARTRRETTASTNEEVEGQVSRDQIAFLESAL